jgi:phosphoglycolate phosphatase-like HAD superfamily hydrolase
MTDPTLVLFDVDGTLLITGGAGSRCIRRAMTRVFGRPIEWKNVTVGRLDPQIYHDLAAANQLADPAARHDDYQRAYLAELESELVVRAAEVKRMPGVDALLTRLRQWRDDHPTFRMGVLTGNYREAVVLKFKAAGIDPSVFDMIITAEDGPDRPALVEAALKRYGELAGAPADPKQVIIVGDTPRDVACAHETGCRCLAVATGRYGQQALADAGADRVVGDLTDPAAVLEWACDRTG